MSVFTRFRQSLMTKYFGGKKRFKSSGHSHWRGNFFGQQLAVSRDTFTYNQTQFKSCISCLFTVL